ncbi:NB-ARC domain-containing protein [Amycolatopsis sp. cmx-8-4]|uniref:NB-ARC domain-containing protein n=1 Tax=Amycolatopsis sp. cmx-8-4 TaxID=2790947 RepID=UPI00397CB449
MDGGRVAAWGFLYQYLCTVEAVLAAVENDRFEACRVEGSAGAGESEQVDVVDFDLVGPDGEVLLAAQVKTGGSTASLGTGVAYRIMVELVTRCSAERYELLTNVRLAPGAAKVADLLACDDLSVAERRAQLTRVLAEARSSADVTELTDDQVQRLGRCRLLVDHRDRTDVADGVKTKVRDFRRNYGRGVGPRSSGLLLAHLLAEVHRRAAFEEHAVWTKAEVTRAVVQDERDIVDVLDGRDWGSVLGLMAPVPDLPRGALVEQIVGALQPYRPTGRSVRHCALTGLSGIGKSSLAASYVAAYADAYQAIYWIDATSPDSIEDGFQTVAIRLGLERYDTSERLRSAVHEALSTQTGRFLLVFDDAMADLAQRWLPRLADADVLITTIDSTARLGSSIAVTALTSDEAVELIHLRLDEPPAESGDQARRLAEALERWPLALELATGYLRGCGYTLADVDYYLQQLKVRSLGDNLAVPRGYPRTLVAAIDLGLDVLHRSNSTEIAALATEFLKRASYLSGRRIPVQLLTAPLAVGTDNLSDFDNISEHAGPAIVRDPQLSEAVRALRRISFARHDERLAWRASDLVPAADHTIAVNAVLQEVVRTRLESPTREEWNDELRRLALHVNHWLSAATHNLEVSKAHQLAPHAATLVGHLRRLGVAGRRIAVLAGNLAGIYVAAGRNEEAIDLLRSEINMILDDADGGDSFLEHQARLHLARALVNSDQAGHFDPHPAVTELARVLTCTQRLALNDETHAPAVTFCAYSLSILSFLHDRMPVTHRSNALVSVFRDLQKRLPSTALTEEIEAFERINQMISKGDDRGAESISRALLMQSRYGSSLDTELRRLLVEALVRQGKWNECGVEIDNLAIELGNPPLSYESAQQALHNIALALVAKTLDYASPEPRLLLRRLLGKSCFVHVSAIATGEYRAKFELFALNAAVCDGSIKDIDEALTKVAADVSQSHLVHDPHVAMLSREIIARAQAALSNRN